MFARPRISKTALRSPAKKRRRVLTAEEISFDKDARSDYLTGFHKRKQQRIKHAQEIAAEKARQDKIEFRKQLREERQQAVEKHVQNVNALLREAQQAGQEDDANYLSASGDEGWTGFEEEKLAEPVDHMEEYIDEDKYTSVTIEPVDIDRDGLHKAVIGSGDNDEPDPGAGEGRSSDTAARTKKSHPPKKRRKKFRYETKTERQSARKKAGRPRR